RLTILKTVYAFAVAMVMVPTATWEPTVSLKAAAPLAKSALARQPASRVATLLAPALATAAPPTCHTACGIARAWLFARTILPLILPLTKVLALVVTPLAVTPLAVDPPAAVPQMMDLPAVVPLQATTSQFPTQIRLRTQTP